MEKRSVRAHRNRKPHVCAQFLPLLNNSGIMRQVGRAMQELFGLCQIIALDIAIPEAGQCIPVVRIITTCLFKDGDRLATSTIILEEESGANPRIRQIACDGSIVRRNLMGDGKDSQIILPLLLLRQGQRDETDGEEGNRGCSNDSQPSRKVAYDREQQCHSCQGQVGVAAMQKITGFSAFRLSAGKSGNSKSSQPVATAI